MKDTLPITFINPPAGAIPISWEIADAIGVRENDLHFDIKTYGMWQIPVRCVGVRMSSKFDQSHGYTRTDAVTVWGVGTLSSPKESGHTLEGRSSVPVFGKCRAFTSSQMFVLPDGKLRDCAEIFCSVYSNKE